MLGALFASMLVGAQVTPADFDVGFADGLAGVFRGGSTFMAHLFVSPAGVVEECNIVWTDWPRRPAERACERLRGDKVTQVARRGDGTPVHGTVLFSMVSRPAGARAPEGPPYSRLADLAVSVTNIPASANGKVTVSALVLVDAQGTIVDCSANPDAGAAPAGFGAVACEQLAPVRPPVRHGPGGTPVPYVTDLVVEFVEDAGAPS